MAAATINPSPLEYPQLNDKLVSIPLLPTNMVINGVKCTIIRAATDTVAPVPVETLKPSETHQSKVDIEPLSKPVVANGPSPLEEKILSTLEERVQRLADKCKHLIENVMPFVIIIAMLLFVGLAGFSHVNNQLNAQSKYIAQLNRVFHQDMTKLYNVILTEHKPTPTSSTNDAPPDAKQPNVAERHVQDMAELIPFIRKEIRTLENTLRTENSNEYVNSKMERRIADLMRKEDLLHQLLASVDVDSVAWLHLKTHVHTYVIVEELKEDIASVGLYCRVDKGPSDIGVYVASSPTALMFF
jgi:hypothetical protein